MIKGSLLRSVPIVKHFGRKWAKNGPQIGGFVGLGGKIF